MLSPLTHDDPHAVASYRLLARLGSGGMGTVYLARTPRGRTVALKTMHARLAADPVSRSRFRLEADAARIIGARHGAAVFDADPLADTPWLATEYVLGPPLDAAVTLGGPLPEPTVRALGAALAGALAQLHSSEVVHRDLKPSNVLVTAYGPKIIDFGIARAAGDQHLTRTGAAAGTPAFMSPEQASGQEHTPAGDVFALAGVLVFAATGHGPFGTGSPADLLYRVRYAEPDLTGTPEALLPLLVACLTKDPSARPTTARLITELHDGGGQFADHLPPQVLADIARRATDVWLHRPLRLPAPATHSSPTPTAVPVPHPVPRRRLLALSAAGLLGLAAAGAAARAWLGADGGGGDGRPPGDPTPTAVDGARSPLWQVASEGHEEQALPLVAGDVLGLAETASFRVLDQVNGAELWSERTVTEAGQITTDGISFYMSSSPAAYPGTLRIRTLASRTGQESARPVELRDFDGIGTQLLIAAGGILFAATRRGRRDDSPAEKKTGLHHLAVDLRTGRELWRHPYPWDGDHFWLSRVVADRLILGRHVADSGFFALQSRDLRTGRMLWQRRLPLRASQAFRQGELAVDEQHVYLGDDRLRALRLSDGTTAWEYGSGADTYGMPAVANGLVYVTEGTGRLVGVHAERGTAEWKEDTAATPPSTRDPRTAPVIGGTFVYAPVRGGLSAIDVISGRSAWVFATAASRYVVDPQRTRIFGAGKTSVVALPLA
ncbi:protein kinase [Streptomyces sp. NPDC058855]|uniref:serine/threonine-protein kinase n=1 Tax=Streptomyces sp. NPDC058855 TaxID=3346651 RepID=UPI003689227F